MKIHCLTIALLVAGGGPLWGNGGAWQEGIPGTGSASASDKKHKTNVAIEEEALSIDLGPESATVDVHYRMHNTGAKVQQEFFFPVERWGTPPGEEARTPTELAQYKIAVDGQELKWTDVHGPKEETAQVASGLSSDEKVPVIKSWKKSVIPFEKDQRREVVIHYYARYSENNESVSDDEHISDATFAYSLSPAATWKGPIGKGRIDLNIFHAEPEDVSVARPKDRFQKLSDTHYQWNFENLKPSLADDLRIIAHSKYDRYPTGYSTEDFARRNSYVLRSHQYFFDHTDYDAVASSTLAPQGAHNYDVTNIKGDPQREVASPWAEGVEGDGLGESIALTVKRPLPLYGILIRSGYYDYDDKGPWLKNNRVATLEISLNNEHTFTENIPDEQFSEPYLIRVRDYAKPVTQVKMVIKAVHHGTEFHDTCISLVRLRAALSNKPEVQAAR